MRYLINHLRTIALFIAALALVGCAQVPRGAQADDVKAKQFTPQADTASLYIYRPEFFGAALTMNVKVNGQFIGHTGPQSYFHLNVAPGMYKIESATDHSASLNIEVAAGKNYFVWQEVKMSVLLTNSKLTQTDEDTGRKGVMGSKLIASKIPGSAIAPMGGVTTAVAPAPTPVPTPVPALASTPAPAAAPAPRSAPAPATGTVAMPFVPDSKPVARTAAPAAVPAAQSVPTTATVAVVSPAQPAPAATAAAAAPASASKKESRLQWLKQMRDANLITSGEYETKRQQVLSAP